MHSQVIDEIAKHLGITTQDIDPGASLADNLGLGPIEVADLLSYLSRRFNVNFDPSEIEGLKTVNDIIEAIEDLSLE